MFIGRSFLAVPEAFRAGEPPDVPLARPLSVGFVLRTAQPSINSALPGSAQGVEHLEVTLKPGRKIAA